MKDTRVQPTTSSSMMTVARDSEAKLIEMANTVRDAPAGYYAIHFHLSRLQERYRSEFQIKIALNIITDLSKNQEGGIFVCRDHDIFVLYKTEDKALVEKVIFQLRYLFIDDPLAYLSDETENPQFSTVYVLAFQWKEFFIACKHKIGDAVRTEVQEIERKSGSILPLTPTTLARIEPDLCNIELGQLLRLQAVCAVVPGKEMRTIFHECYVHIAHLQQALHAEIDFQANPSLFRYVTEILDRRLLHTLRTKPNAHFRLPMSINLNIQSLYSDEFAMFDASIEPKLKSSIILELHIADVFSDMAAFMTAKQPIQQLGYRICLDGLNSLSFPQIDRENLGFDLVKLQWNADLESALETEENKKLAETVKRFGASRVILCRCDTSHAIQYGRALGIALFQGRHIDKVLNPQSKVTN